MNSRLKKFRAKHYKAPEPISPPKPPRPSISNLKKIYHDLISADVDQRVETLKKAVHWYEGAQAYTAYFKEFSHKQKIYLNSAQKQRVTALMSNKDLTKEIALIAAIRNYEKVVRKLHPPKVNTYWSKFSKVKSKLENRRKKFNRKYREFIDTVDFSLKPVNYSNHRIKLRVDKLNQTYLINPEGDITFDRKFLDIVRRTARKNGLLSGLISLLPILAESAAMTMEKDSDGHRTGRYLVHGSVKAKAYQTMLENLVQHCLSSKQNVRLIRRHKDKLAASVNTAA